MGLDVFRFTNILTVGLTLREMCPNTEILWSVFFRIRTDYGEIQNISPYLV